MNKAEKMKETIIKSCAAGEMTIKSAAVRLNLSDRQIKRLKARYKKNGEKSMLHGNCGRQPKNTTDVATKEKIPEIRRLEVFNEVNTRHFREIPAEKHEIEVSYTFLSELFKGKGIKSPKRHRARQ